MEIAEGKQAVGVKMVAVGANGACKELAKVCTGWVGRGPLCGTLLITGDICVLGKMALGLGRKVKYGSSKKEFIVMTVGSRSQMKIIRFCSSTFRSCRKMVGGSLCLRMFIATEDCTFRLWKKLREKATKKI